MPQGFTYPANNIQDKTYVREIEDGIYERFDLTGTSGKPAWAVAGGSTTAGTNCHQAAFWYARQQAMNTLVANNFYIKGGSVGIPPQGVTELKTTLQGVASIPLFTTTASFWTQVVGSPHGPRRLTSAGYWTNGYCTRGDRVGPYILEDLVKALRFLIVYQVDANALVRPIYDMTNILTGLHSELNANWNDDHFADAIANHETKIRAWTATQPIPQRLIERWQKLRTTHWSYGSGLQTYRAQSWGRAGSVLITGINPAYEHALLLMGYFVQLGGTTFWPIGTGDDFAANHYGKIYVDATWQTASFRAYNLKDLADWSWDAGGGIPGAPKAPFPVPTSGGQTIYRACRVGTAAGELAALLRYSHSYY